MVLTILVQNILFRKCVTLGERGAVGDPPLLNIEGLKHSLLPVKPKYLRPPLHAGIRNISGGGRGSE